MSPTFGLDDGFGELSITQSLRRGTFLTPLPLPRRLRFGRAWLHEVTSQPTMLTLADDVITIRVDDGQARYRITDEAGGAVEAELVWTNIPGGTPCPVCGASMVPIHADDDVVRFACWEHPPDEVYVDVEHPPGLEEIFGPGGSLGFLTREEAPAREAIEQRSAEARPGWEHLFRMAGLDESPS